MNFGEEIAYWYLRLNGFFPLTNFVLHQGAGRKASDCDVLAVRPPFVYEKVGGTPDDWVQWLQDLRDGNPTLGVICEVKSGHRARSMFEDDRVDQSVMRLGFTEEDLSDAELKKLQETWRLDIGDYRVLKLLVADRKPKKVPKECFVSISRARDFIKERVRSYKEKQGDWLFFNSNLMQDLIWEVKAEVRAAKERDRKIRRRR